MLSKPKKKYYVVFAGRKVGIFETWKDCQEQINSFSGAIFKSFENLEQAKRSFEDYKNIIKINLRSETDIVNALKEYRLIFFVDGSYLKSESKNNTFSSGIVVFFLDKKKRLKKLTIHKKFSNQLFAETHNIAGELMATVTAMKYIVSIGAENSLICHDYIGISEFCNNWTSKKEIINLYQAIYKTNFLKSPSNKISFLKLKGHADNIYINLADKLAKKGQKNKYFSPTIDKKEVLNLKFSNLTSQILEGILKIKFPKIKIVLDKNNNYEKIFWIRVDNLETKIIFNQRIGDLCYVPASENNEELNKLVKNLILKEYRFSYNGLNDFFTIKLDSFSNLTKLEVLEIIKTNFTKYDFNTFIVSIEPNNILVIENFSPIKLFYAFCLIVNNFWKDYISENDKDLFDKIIKAGFNYLFVVKFLFENYDDWKDSFLKENKIISFPTFLNFKELKKLFWNYHF